MNGRSIALLAALALSGPALGGSVVWAGEPVDQMRVKVADLNLRSDVGADRAFRRIQTAAQSFCDVPREERSLARRAAGRQCQDRMTYLAVNKLDSRLVTARYERSGSSPPIQLASR